MTCRLARDAEPEDTTLWVSTPTAELERLAKAIETARGGVHDALSRGLGSTSPEVLAAVAAVDAAIAALAAAEVYAVDLGYLGAVELRAGEIVRLDDEYVTVLLVGVDSALVQRGVLGSEAASHATGADLVPVQFLGTPTAELVAGEVVFQVEGDPAIDVGVKSDVVMPFSGEWVGWTLLADAVGELEVDVWKAALASYPPDVSGSIVGSSPPRLESQDVASNALLTGWTRIFAEGDVVRVSVTSCSGVARASIALKYRR